MSASLIIEPSGLPRLEAMLARLAERGGDMSELMEQIGMYEEGEAIERFNREEAPDGSKWEPSLRAKEEGGKTLTDTARLKQSITYRAGRDRVEIGTNVIYAGTHQGGATIRAKSGPHLKFQLPGGLGFRSVAEVTIPARPFLGLGADSEDEIVALAEDWLAGGLQ